MADPWLLGTLSGAAAMLIRSALVLPIAASPLASPWAHWGGLLIGHPPNTHRARAVGMLVMAAWGAWWGIAFAAWDQVHAPPFRSFVLQGMILGSLVFGVEAAIIAVWRRVRRHVGRRLWVGLFLADVLFGATVGLAFLLLGPHPPTA